MTRRFKHSAQFTVARGRWRVTCCCGWPGERGASHEECEAAYAKHVNHREKQERVKVSTGVHPEDLAIGTMMLHQFAHYEPQQLH